MTREELEPIAKQKAAIVEIDYDTYYDGFIDGAIFMQTSQDDLKGCYYNRCKFCGYRPTCEMQKELVRKDNEIKKLEEEKKLAREQEVRDMYARFPQ